ncbi:MAG: ABC transporter permease [Proteobacteria bacterium]|nr:ABC transporter permease [Pseudomonadota bacterium]
MAAVYILWLRHMRRYVRAPARIAAALGQPLLYLVAIGLGLRPSFERAGGGDYIQFLAPGVISMAVLLTAIVSGVEIIWDRQFGFLKETLVAPVSRLTIVTGRTLGGATAATLQGVILFAACLVLGFRPADLRLLPAALGIMFLIAIAAAALGTAIGSSLEDMQAFPLIMNFVVMPLFFFSGAVFPVRDLPTPLRIASQLNPLTYGVDALRGVLSHASVFGVWTDVGVLCAAAAVFLAVGGYLFSKIQL